MKITLALLAAVLASASASSTCSTDESNLDSYAEKKSKGKSPDGKCYSHVADYIDAVGYGGINAGHFNDCIPSQYWSYAYQFADYLNTGNNAASLCLSNVQSKYSNNPYNAPTGAIVVVRAGTPGTSNPVAGDIAVVGGNGQFWNGGEMSYGGSSNFPSSNDYVLGIYVPTTCTPNCPNVPSTAPNATRDADFPWRTHSQALKGSTCTGSHEFCCEAPNNDPNNCPSSAYTDDCAAEGSCCCA